MADLKFIECEERTLPENIKNGSFTDYMFMMYKRGEGEWYRNTLFPCAQFIGPSNVTGGACGAVAYEDIRVSLDKDGKAVFTKADVVLSSLAEKAKTLGLPELDKVYAAFALRELVKVEKQFLTQDSYFVARLTLSGMDPFCEYPCNSGLFTITLQWFEGGLSEGGNMTFTVCPVLSPVYGTAVYAGASYTAKAQATAMGYSDALWLDCIYKKYILGASGADVFFRIDDEVITPANEHSLMTNTVCALLSEWGLSPVKRKISVDELEACFEEGKVTEIFMVDNRKIIVPVASVEMGEKEYTLKTGKLSIKLYDSLRNIERGVLLSPAYKTERI